MSVINNSSIQNPIKIVAGSDVSMTIHRVIGEHMGGRDGDYFIMSEASTDNKKTKTKYKIVLVEDIKGKRHTFYFEIC